MRVLPLNVVAEIGRFVPAEGLVPFRRVCSRHRIAVARLLAECKEVADSLDAYLQDALQAVDQQLVWVGLRARPFEDPDASSHCLRLDRKRASFKSVKSGSGCEAEAFFFDATFGSDVTQLDVWSKLGPRVMRCVVRRQSACICFHLGSTSPPNFLVIPSNSS